MSDNNEITLDCDLPRIDSTKRKAAEDYLLRLYGDRDRLQLEVFREFVERDHVAGQECGEQREREAVVKWLSEGAGGLELKVNRYSAFSFTDVADAIERGEHRGEE